MNALTVLLIYAIFLGVGFYLLFVVVRAAVLSALRKHAQEQLSSSVPGDAVPEAVPGAAAPDAQASASEAQASSPE